MKKTRKKTITHKEQQVAAEILTAFTFVKNMEDVQAVWERIYKQYELCEDPFTRLPCSAKEYEENRLEYEQQISLARYGYYDF